MHTRKQRIYGSVLNRSLGVLCFLGLGFLSGCASLGPKTGGGAVGQIIRDSNSAPNPESSTNTKSVVQTNKSGSDTHMEVWGQKLKTTKFDLPVFVNPAVEHWITYFTGKGRKYFDKYLERSRYFVPVISKVLKSHNMPQDLVYLAMIESGFNNSAKSHAKAVGPWQFIRQTGQRYGLTVNYWLDERRDTRKSTLAAIAYLKELYQEFGSWELAAAGYNAGENKVRRAIAKYRTNDFWEISRHKFLRRETKDYVPKMWAAAILAKNPEQFGFVSPFKSNGTTTQIAGDVETEEPTPKELGEPVALNEDTTEDSSDKPTDDKAEDLAAADDDAPEGSFEGSEGSRNDAAMVSQTPRLTMTPSVYMVANPNEQILEYEVKGPADLFAISKASGLPFSTIKLLNPELLRWCTPPYLKTYRVKLPLSVKDRFLATYNDESFDRRVVFMRYKVRRGDTIQKLAHRFGTEADPIREINQDINARLSSSLPVGNSINLPIPTGYKRVIASMYDDKSVPSRRRRGKRYHRGRKRAAASTIHYRHGRVRPNIAGG